LKSKKKYKRYWFQGSSFTLTWIYVIVLMVLYSFSRLALWIVSPSLFPWEGFGSFLQIVFGGCRFDLSAVFMVNLVFFTLINVPFHFREYKGYRIITSILFLITNLIAILSNLVDSVYFRFTQKRMTGDFFNYLKAGGQDVIQLLPQYLKDFWYLLVALAIVLIIVLFLVIKVSYTVPTSKKMFGRVKEILLFLLIAAASVICIRGGFQLKPIHLMTAGQYASPGHIPLVLNTPFSIIKTWNQKEIREVRYFSSDKDLEKVFSPVRLPGSKPWQPLNVVVIIMESFSAEHSAFLNPALEKENYKGFTPFLDSLMSVSLTYRGYANGKRSIEAIPAILCSLPSWMNNDYITSSFAGNKINSLANLLKTKGYRSYFFHGGNNGTMNFDDFAAISGFDSYLGRNEYHNDKDFDGKWGIYDGPFFQYTARELDKSPEPFIAALFSLSSHHPYLIPPGVKGKFPKGKLEIEESIGYADYSLKQFFKTASAMPWFKRTLFVITADHTSESNLDFYKTRVGNYVVPIVFYQPESKLSGFGDKTVQQLDIMPSILDYIGYPHQYISFGSSVFDSENIPYALSFLNNSYLFVRNHKAMIVGENKITSYFDLVKDPDQKINLVEKGNVPKDNSLSFLRAIIQQYNNRVIHNQLVVRNEVGK
jgi:phosphoglycerol transferase MdoB-like AlkP superfamily enzyme